MSKHITLPWPRCYANTRFEWLPCHWTVGPGTRMPQAKAIRDACSSKIFETSCFLTCRLLFRNHRISTQFKKFYWQLRFKTDAQLPTFLYKQDCKVYRFLFYRFLTENFSPWVFLPAFMVCTQWLRRFLLFCECFFLPGCVEAIPVAFPTVDRVSRSDHGPLSDHVVNRETSVLPSCVTLWNSFEQGCTTWSLR